MTNPPPAEVLDATTVFFDSDGVDRQPGSPRTGVIADVSALDAFEARYVDDDPSLGRDARAALEGGKVLIGGPVSVGCFPASGALLAFSAVDIRLLPTGLSRPDPNIECVRAVTSVALMAIDPADLPAGLPVGGD